MKLLDVLLGRSATHSIFLFEYLLISDFFRGYFLVYMVSIIPKVFINLKASIKRPAYFNSTRYNIV